MRRRRRGERGAAAVEGALVFGFFLVPLVLGMLYFGNRFWRDQATPTAGPQFAADSIVGSLTCQQLKGRLADVLILQASQAGQLLGLTPDQLHLQIVKDAVTGVPTVTISLTGVGVGGSTVPIPSTTAPSVPPPTVTVPSVPTSATSSVPPTVAVPTGTSGSTTVAVPSTSAPVTVPSTVAPVPATPALLTQSVAVLQNVRLSTNDTSC